MSATVVTVKVLSPVAVALVLPEASLVLPDCAPLYEVLLPPMTGEPLLSVAETEAVLEPVAGLPRSQTLASAFTNDVVTCWESASVAATLL